MAVILMSSRLMRDHPSSRGISARRPNGPWLSFSPSSRHFASSAPGAFQIPPCAAACLAVLPHAVPTKTGHPARHPFQNLWRPQSRLRLPSARLSAPLSAPKPPTNRLCYIGGGVGLFDSAREKIRRAQWLRDPRSFELGAIPRPAYALLIDRPPGGFPI